MVEKSLEKSPPQKNYIHICCLLLVVVGIPFSQKQPDKSKSWQIFFRDKTDKLDSILKDTFFIDLKTSISQEVKTLKYTSNGYITGLEKRRGLSYTIAIYNDFYEKKTIQNIEQYLYRPIVVKMKPLYAKVSIAIKDVTQKEQTDYRIVGIDSFTVKKSKFPINYSISSFFDTTLWKTIDNSGILRLKEIEKKSKKNLLLSYDINIDRITQVNDFTIRINESVSSRPPTMYYDIVGFDANDSKYKQKVPKEIINFKLNFPDNPFEGEAIKLLFYNSGNFYFSNSNTQISKPWISDICTLVINSSDIEYSINLNQLPDFDFLYIASYKLVKRMKWYDYLNSLLKDIKGNDYFLYLSNNTSSVYYDTTQQIQPVLQKILENEYDPPDIIHDRDKIRSIVNFDELIPQRRGVTFHFFFTDFINSKSKEGIIMPIIKKLGPQMQFTKVNIYSSDKKGFDFLINLNENERKNVFFEVL